jgi:hypothetical protein
MWLKDNAFECDKCDFQLDYIHGLSYNEISYTDDKGSWHDVPEGCMLVVAWEPAKGRSRMWWQRKRESFCLKCGKKMRELFEDGPETCDECGFSMIRLDDGGLSYKFKEREWHTVPSGFLLVAAWEEERVDGGVK